MKAKIYTKEGKESGEVNLPEEIFNANVNDSLMHLVVKSYLANKRQGTAKTKSRSEVSGGGRKPFKQKGTGRARAGSNTSPIWVRGGKAFGALPRDYSGTIPKKMRKAAMVSALTCRARSERISVLSGLDLSTPKTKSVYTILKDLSFFGKKNLLVIGEDERNLYLSGRNIKNVHIRCVNEINALDILWSDNILFSSEDIISRIEYKESINCE